MQKYTLETLKELNYSYDKQHTVTESDVELVNKLVKLIESTRSQEHTEVGDVVRYTSKYGEYYAHAHIEKVKDGQLYICESPYVPFTEVINFGTRIVTDTSGGAWHHIPNNLEFVGTEQKMFKAWGHCGATANGAVQFEATVSVWRYVDGEHAFTTETHDKYTVTIREQDKSGDLMDYKYVISKGIYNQIAFYTDEEYQAWLKTMHGVETPGAWDNLKIVWAYKHKTVFEPLEEYLAIENAIIDSTLENGTIQECKRIVEGTSILTVLPYQHEKIELKGEKCFRNAYL